MLFCCAVVAAAEQNHPVMRVLLLLCCHYNQGHKPGTKCGGTSCAGGLGDRIPPVEIRGEAPVGGLGDEVPELKQFSISICIILTCHDNHISELNSSNQITFICFSSLYS